MAVNGNFALVAVNTSASFANPSGELVVVKVNQRSIVRRMPLAGQPDSVAISPDGRYAAIIIENERDEELNDGLIPQPPAGLLQVVDCKGTPDKWTFSSVELTGLAEVAPSDPEPETPARALGWPSPAQLSRLLDPTHPGRSGAGAPRVHAVRERCLSARKR